MGSCFVGGAPSLLGAFIPLAQKKKVAGAGDGQRAAGGIGEVAI